MPNSFVTGMPRCVLEVQIVQRYSQFYLKNKTSGIGQTLLFLMKKVDETSINLAMMIRNHVPWIRIANNLDTTFRNEIFYYTCQQNSRNL